MTGKALSRDNDELSFGGAFYVRQFLSQKLTEHSGWAMIKSITENSKLLIYR